MSCAGSPSDLLGTGQRVLDVCGDYVVGKGPAVVTAAALCIALEHLGTSGARARSRKAVREDVCRALAALDMAPSSDTVACHANAMLALIVEHANRIRIPGTSQVCKVCRGRLFVYSPVI
jgi:hypothetical protein